jgi:acetyl-CoA/propionyl-CoA carboxylase biotin carboxyl carrier protein
MRPEGADFPFDTVLVANRGEIAVRVLRTVRALGLRGLVVHHAADAGSPAVRLADALVEITGPTPTAAYLDAGQIIAKALDAGAQAIHPGYGFLSENADFARQVEGAGMVFVGPAPETIELLGDKVSARDFAGEHGFPIAPSAVEAHDPATFADRIRAIGGPMLIKPAGGGGGKGMRIVRDLTRLEEELERARGEAGRYFGDPRLYAERYVERPRHIEVQVLGDAYGEVVHLFERECSLQRRFQKVVEEAPSSALTDAERARICDAAAGIARAARYRNAGTVEFIHGGDTFYFLEMNTRLQVEHPVTEAITGLDLVAEQLKIAAGRPLGFTQAQVTRIGHAVEARIYAEDPARGFTPATGRLLAYSPPVGDGVRVDSGVSEGQEITPAFDPLMAKLVVHGVDRQQALERAARALADFVVLGCRTNIGFLKRLLRDPDVLAGALHTDLIAEKPALAADPTLSPETLTAVLGAAALSIRTVRDSAIAVPPLHAAMRDWRN